MPDPEPRAITDPVVVVAFSGWNDAGNAASDTLQRLLESHDSVEISAINDERYFDFEVSRPALRSSPDGPWIAWPQITLRHLQLSERDLVVVLGPEPSLLWRSFADDLISRIQQFHPRLVILLGAMLSDTPHTRPLPVAMSTNDQALRERLMVEELRYEGPIGVTGVINQLLIAAGIPSAAMWVSIPHYVGNAPNPKAQHALLSRLEKVLEIPLGAEEVEREAAEWAIAVNILSSEDPEVADYIGQLEEARDALDAAATAESLAAEFERYLRDQD